MLLIKTRANENISDFHPDYFNQQLFKIFPV